MTKKRNCGCLLGALALDLYPAVSEVNGMGNADACSILFGDPIDGNGLSLATGFDTGFDDYELGSAREGGCFEVGYKVGQIMRERSVNEKDRESHVHPERTQELFNSWV